MPGTKPTAHRVVHRRGENLADCASQPRLLTRTALSLPCSTMTIHPLRRLNRFAHLLSLAALALAAPSLLHAQWQQTGGPLGPDLRSLLVSENTLIAGTSVGVFSLPLDGTTTTWTERNTGMAPFVTVQGLGRSGPNLLAATTGGLFLSTNNGLAWRAIDLGQPVPSLFCFLRVGASLFMGGSTGVLVSTDDGATWTAMRNGLPTNQAVRTLLQSGATLLAGTAGGGVFVSTNNGASWTAANTGLASPIVRGLAARGGRIFAATNGGGVFATDDLGATWTLKSTGITSLEVPAIIADGTSIYAGTNGGGAFVTTDGGETWRPVNSGITLSTVFAFTAGGGVLYSGTAGGGVFRTGNGGATWTTAGSPSPLPGKAAILSVASAPGLMIAGAGGGGLSISADNGSTWTNVIGNANINALARLGNTLLAGTNDLVYASSNNGLTWRKTGDAGFTGTHVLFSLTVLGSRIFAGTAGTGVFTSGDGGASWTSANSPAMQNAIVSALGTNGGAVFAGTSANGVFRSLDQGATWTAANTGLPAARATSFATINHNLFLTTASGVFLSANNGASWTAVNTGLTSLNVLSSLAYGTDLYVGTNAGVFVTQNNGATWTPVNTGWTTRTAAIALAGDQMIIGTDFGVLRRPLAEIVGPAVAAAGAPRLANVSSRAVLDATGTLIVGFVIAGDAPKRMLLRGVGPTLGSFGVTGAMTDPRLEVFRAGAGATAPIASTDNWTEAPNDIAAIVAATASAGAFPLAASSRDAALAGTFSPGAYTVQLRAATGGGGAALIEIYELP